MSAAARWCGGGSITGAYNIIKLDLAQSVYKAAAPWARSANFVKEPPLIANVINLELNVGLLKSVNLKYITMGRLDEDMIVLLSDGAMFILID